MANKIEKSEEFSKSKEKEDDQSNSSKAFAIGAHKDSQWWDISTFSKADNKYGLLAESSFSVRFPKYREKYIRESWPLLEKTMADYNLKVDLDILEGTAEVKTTRKTWDPYIIIKARDVIKLISRSVPFEQAIRVLQDDISCEIIKISSMVSNKEKFVKRRERLVGTEGSTLRAIELLSECYVAVQGGTVAAVGPYHGLKHVSKIVTDCMNNIHPMYTLKEMLVKRTLMKDPSKKDESWEEYMPKYRKKVQSSSSTKQVKKKLAARKMKKKNKEYTPFPPPQTPRKIDLQLESGEYFLNEKAKQVEKKRNKWHAQSEKTYEKKKERAATLVAPEEKKKPKQSAKRPAEQIDLEKFKLKVKKVRQD